MAETTLFEQLGGEPVLRGLVARFVDRMFDDPMIGFFFRKADRQRVKDKEYELAARQDNVDGQIGLGVLYSLGQGVEKNFVEAYKWLRIAADRLPQGSDRSRVIGALDAIAESMSKDEVAEAKKLAKAWRPNP